MESGEKDRVAERLAELWEEYDELVADVGNSGYQTFSHNLRRWFVFLDSSAPIAGVVLRTENLAEFKSWYDRCLQTMGGMVGSAQLDWPEDVGRQLGLKLGLFRAFATENVQSTDFCLHFLYVRGDFNAQVSNLITQLFLPMARELRRYVRRQIQREAELLPVVPAADRFVDLNHNSAAYREAVEALKKAEEAVSEANDYDDLDDRELRVAEISATRRLLQSTRVRVAAITMVAGPTLTWLAEKFAGGVIGQLASAAWKAIGQLLGGL